MEQRTQDFLQVQTVKDGVVVLKNNQVRGVLMISSVNFALKSEEVQNSIIASFQNFLNSLDFYCQILVQSRKINITPYLDKVKELEEHQTNELLKTQTASYREFIKELIEEENVVTKSFYLVVPYLLTDVLGVSGIGKQYSFLNFGGKKSGAINGISDDDFQRCKAQLWQRMDFLATGLKRCGLDAVPLETPELIELFWANYHPTEAESGYVPEIAPEFLQ